MPDPDDLLRQRIQIQLERRLKAQNERRTLLAETAALGTLGVQFLLPVIAGACLGRWLDTGTAGYSTRWTVSLIVMGLLLGAWNVYRSIEK